MFAVSCSDENDSSEFSFTCNEQSNQSFRFILEHDLPTLQKSFDFDIDFQHRQASMLYDTLVA